MSTNSYRCAGGEIIGIVGFAVASGTRVFFRSFDRQYAGLGKQRLIPMNSALVTTKRRTRQLVAYGKKRRVGMAAYVFALVSFIVGSCSPNIRVVPSVGDLV